MVGPAADCTEEGDAAHDHAVLQDVVVIVTPLPGGRLTEAR